MMNILVGTVLGFLSGLGIGGGSLLILWLTLVQQTEVTAARNINLLFFLPCALIAALFRWKQGSLPFRKILPTMAAGCASAFLFSIAGRNMNTDLLRKLFGGLLIITGFRELFYKEKNRAGS